MGKRRVTRYHGTAAVLAMVTVLSASFAIAHAPERFYLLPISLLGGWVVSTIGVDAWRASR